jgi:ParB-like chromosome segregation protein Spo0J
MVERLDWKLMEVPLEELHEHLSRYRVISQESLEVMQGSMVRYGQIAPLVVFRRSGCLEVIDGFKRLRAARALGTLRQLCVREMDCDDRCAKAAIYLLNRVGGRTGDLEEAWIVQSLVRDDELSQVEVAELLGRHKSWVSRRLALIERLCPEAKEDLQLGMLSPTAAREIYRLPYGNQAEVLEAVRRESFSTGQIRLLVDQFLGCATRQQQEFVLKKSAEAVATAQGVDRPSHDPRLTAVGNQVSKRLSLLLELLGRMDTWLRTRGRAELGLGDLEILSASFGKLQSEAQAVAEAAADFLQGRIKQ